MGCYSQSTTLGYEAESESHDGSNGYISLIQTRQQRTPQLPFSSQSPAAIITSAACMQNMLSAPILPGPHRNFPPTGLAPHLTTITVVVSGSMCLALSPRFRQDSRADSVSTPSSLFPHNFAGMTTTPPPLPSLSASELSASLPTAVLSSMLCWTCRTRTLCRSSTRVRAESSSAV